MRWTLHVLENKAPKAMVKPNDAVQALVYIIWKSK